MIKKLALLCCILLFSATAASAIEGDPWIGVQLGGSFADRIDPGITSGATVGYNFALPNAKPWEKYLGGALDFQWNQFDRSFHDFHRDGNQFALGFLGRAQYPFMRDETVTTGRLVPFLMFGPAIVWSERGGRFASHDSTDIGVVAEAGLEYFVIPKLSVGPSFRYRHVWSDFSGADQYMVLGRLAYHF